MKIICEECGSEEWKIAIQQVKFGRSGPYYSVLKCESCGMIYPIMQINQSYQRGMTTEKLKKYFKPSSSFE